VYRGALYRDLTVLKFWLIKSRYSAGAALSLASERHSTVTAANAHVR
jgi:hypothetical protein